MTFGVPSIGSEKLRLLGPPILTSGQTSLLRFYSTGYRGLVYPFFNSCKLELKEDKGQVKGHWRSTTASLD